MLVLLALFIISAYCATGLDVAYATSETAFKCFKDAGYTFAIVRCYRSIGQVDPNCVPNIKNAIAAGFQHVDAYMFPDPKKGDGKSQIRDVANALSGVSYGIIWVDIEGSQYWLGDHDKNKAFLQELLDGVSEQYVHAGIYSSSSQWEDIFGSSQWKGPTVNTFIDKKRLNIFLNKQLPLWYAHYDGQKTFNDYETFGGWSSPHMKQYEGDKNECGVDLDRNTEILGIGIHECDSTVDGIIGKMNMNKFSEIQNLAIF